MAGPSAQPSLAECVNLTIDNESDRRYLTMKRYLSCATLALGAAALLGLAASARADGAPAPLPKGPIGAGAPVVTTAPPVPAAAASAAAAPAAPVVMALPPASGCGAVPAACCAAPTCEPALKKVCVGEKATREKTTRVYGEACEDFCIPKCSLFGGFKFGGHGHGDCDTCPDACTEGGCTSCEHKVHQRKYLVVKIKKEDECYNKCHVEYQLEEPKCKKPCADGGCLPEAGGCAGVVIQTPAAPPMPPIEKPQPPKEK
jgi:hypothetical protein